MNKKCPFCKKPMEKFKTLFGKKISYRGFSRENLPLTIPKDTILEWYICGCTTYKGKLGHNRLYLNGELWLYFDGWYRYGIFQFR